MRGGRVVVFTGPWLNLAPYPRVPITSYLESAASRFPSKAALIAADGREYTFAQVWTAARRTARLLQDRGLKKGDRVGIYSPNVPEYAPAFHGVVLAGGVVTTLNPLYRERELVHQLSDAGATALFASRLVMPVGDAVRGELPP